MKTPTKINIKEYKKYKNEVLSKQRKAERDNYYQTQLELYNDHLETSWKIMRIIIGKFEDTKLCRLNDNVIAGKITIDNYIITDAFKEV